MRELFCLIIFIVVIFLGWNQPYSAHLKSITGIGPEPTPPPTTPKMNAARPDPNAKRSPR